MRTLLGAAHAFTQLQDAGSQIHITHCNYTHTQTDTHTHTPHTHTHTHRLSLVVCKLYLMQYSAYGKHFV
jgi:hypothetical protein